MKITRLIKQGIVVAGLYAIASLDLAEPGYLRFKNPADYLPWKKEAFELFSKSCKQNESLPMAIVPQIQNLISQNATQADITRVLGEPGCTQEKRFEVDQWQGLSTGDMKLETTIATWDLSKNFYFSRLGIGGFARVTFAPVELGGAAIKYEVLR